MPPGGYDRMKITVHIGLRMYCADRKKARNGRQTSIAAGDLAWISACYRERGEQGRMKKTFKRKRTNV